MPSIFSSYDFSVLCTHIWKSTLVSQFLTSSAGLPDREIPSLNLWSSVYRLSPKVKIDRFERPTFWEWLPSNNGTLNSHFTFFRGCSILCCRTNQIHRICPRDIGMLQTPVFSCVRGEVIFFNPGRLSKCLWVNRRNLRHGISCSGACRRSRSFPIKQWKSYPSFFLCNFLRCLFGSSKRSLSLFVYSLPIER
jgi:hypothetical protein